MKDFRNRFGTILVCAIQRDSEVFIPSGDSFIQKGDRIGQGIFHSFLKADEDDVEEANERTGGFGSSGVR